MHVFGWLGVNNGSAFTIEFLMSACGEEKPAGSTQPAFEDGLLTCGYYSTLELAFHAPRTGMRSWRQPRA